MGQKITLALGGGAGLGWTHIGVLRALDDAGIEIAAISGTSIGAVAAAAYATGNLDNFEDLARGTNFRTMLRFMDPSFGRGGIIGARTIEKELFSYFGDTCFEDLPMPISTVAADLATGEAVISTTGSIIPAIRASISLPGIFKPVNIDGRLLADGGAVMPVPILAARELAPDCPCVGVNLQGDYINRAKTIGVDYERAKDPNSMTVVKAYVSLSLRNLSKSLLKQDPPDVLITPQIGNYDMQNFTYADELIHIGRKSVEEKLSNIAEL